MGRPSVLQLNVLNRCHHATTQAVKGWALIQAPPPPRAPPLLSSALGLSDGQRGLGCYPLW